MEFLSKIFWNVIYYIHLILTKLNINAFIYDNAITKPLTKYTYIKLFERMKPNLSQYKRVLDVGTGTGRALSAIINNFPKDAQIVGIDIDKHYIVKAKERFKAHSNVEMREQNFYELMETKEKYDAIIFSSSFMLMPYREKALEIAKDMLTLNGKIFFLMTLYEEKREIIEKVKPYLKHYTTIDFGNITYEKEFDSFLTGNDFSISHKERIFYKWNPLFYVFRVFLIECQKLEKV